MVELAGSQQWAKLQELLNGALKRLVVILLPVSVITSIFAHDIVKLAFRRGRFDDVAVAAVALPLSTMVWCVFPWCMQIVLVRAMYARGKFWLGATLSTACIVVAWPLWAASIDLFGKSGIGPGLVLLVLVQAVVFTLAWRKAPQGADAFSGLAQLAVEVAATSAVAGTIGWVLAGWLSVPFAGILGAVVASVFVVAWAAFRRWPGIDPVLSRLRTRFGRT
jgi:peptidoglycan biosynthesis protein MviN/MurJ (putative lipid II flippase)